MEFNTKSILEIIKSIRQEKKINQEDIAASLGIGKMTYYKYERGEINITLDTFFKICEQLNISPIFVLHSSLNENKEPPTFLETNSNVRELELIKIIMHNEALLDKLREYPISLDFNSSHIIDQKDRFKNTPLYSDYRGDISKFLAKFDEIENKNKALFFEQIRNDETLKELFENKIINHGKCFEYWEEFKKMEKLE